MSNKTSKIKNNIQDRNSEAWRKLCEYVDHVAENDLDEFSPREYLGDELFSEILTLPESIGKLKKVKKIWVYGSQLQSIPPEIGLMESLEYFDPYTSYDLHWLPYELTKCKNLKDSRISTRALYGNYKNRMAFPKLDYNPVRYNSETVKCSECSKVVSNNDVEQYWITLRVGTDTVPMLFNSCSAKCLSTLARPPKGYVQFPHKGGADLEQPSYEEWADEHVTIITPEEIKKFNENKSTEKLKPLKLVRKIWEK